MTVPHIAGGIEIRIATMSALPANKPGLRDTVAPGDMPAGVAPLRGVSGIDRHHPAAFGFGFVLQKALQLRKRPGVESPFRFPAPGLDPAADVGEVLNDDDCPRINAGYDPFRENVVAIPSEPPIAAREASQPALCRLRAVGLQLPLETETALDDFAPVPLAEELAGRGDRRVSDAQIDAEGGTGPPSRSGPPWQPPDPGHKPRSRAG